MRLLPDRRRVLLGAAGCAVAALAAAVTIGRRLASEGPGVTVAIGALLSVALLVHAVLALRRYAAQAPALVIDSRGRARLDGRAAPRGEVDRVAGARRIEPAHAAAALARYRRWAREAARREAFR